MCQRLQVISHRSDNRTRAHLRHAQQILELHPGDTFEAVLRRYRDVGPGFDLLRMVLALLIFVGHAKWASGLSGMDLQQVASQAAHTAGAGVLQVTAWSGWSKPVKLALVPMFFSLSGFLVMGSAARLRATSTFLAHRALRIFPSLVVEVLLSAFALGLLFSTVPLHNYFTDPQFFQYLLNAAGDISYSLPGVFAHNPVPYIVNVNLWTLPSEFYCYLVLALLMVTRLAYHKGAFTALMVVLTLVLALLHARTGLSNPLGPFPAHVVVYYFLCGALFFHWRTHIPARLSWFALSLPLSYGLLMFDPLVYLAPMAVVYMTLFVGLLPVPRFRLLASGDYSYGMYLYGFPITQALVAWRPLWFAGSRPHFAALLLVATALTAVFAAFSWHGIEKRALALKRHLPPRWFPMPTRTPGPAAAEPEVAFDARVQPKQANGM